MYEYPYECSICVESLSCVGPSSDRCLFPNRLILLETALLRQEPLRQTEQSRNRRWYCGCAGPEMRMSPFVAGRTKDP